MGACWAVLRTPAGKWLVQVLPVLVPLLRRDGELALSDESAALLMRMSAATIIGSQLASGRNCGAGRVPSPARLLKFQIPVRTWADWGDAVPGFVSNDLVGPGAAWRPASSWFTLTDIATGRTVKQSVPNIAQKMGVRGTAVSAGQVSGPDPWD
ncbi:hypothetical protein AYX19_13680 [Paenarthrobacter ureafaciens]|nr:hypothetical protein AYX19_13680 [Paenarthrobacter ureafaciens]